MIGQAADVGLVVGRRRTPGREVEAGRYSSWNRMSTEMTTSRRQRLHSRLSAVRSSAVARIRGWSAPTGRAGDRLGKLQLVAKVDSGVGDIEDAFRAGLVGEEPGDVPGKGGVEGAARGHRVE